MRWIRRVLWIIKGGLLIVSLVIVALWVRSYWRRDAFSYVTFSDQRKGAAVADGTLTSNRGGLVVEAGRFWTMYDTAASMQRRYAFLLGTRPGWTHRSHATAGDFLAQYGDLSGREPVRWSNRRIVAEDASSSTYRLVTTHWFAALIVGTWPITSIVLLIRRARRRRVAARRGLCRQCGYDLRATPDGAGGLLARCPECGTEVSGPLSVVSGSPSHPSARCTDN